MRARRIPVLLSFILAMHVATAQQSALDSAINELMTGGIALHDEGDFRGAIELYQQARALDETNAFVLYELALSHYQLHEYDESISYASIAAEEESENGLQAIVLLGSIYDEIGKYKKSAKYFEKGLETFGDYYLLWYNLGVTALGNDDFERAEESFKNAISNKLDHANSHFALARLLLVQGRRAEAVYPLLFHNLLQPEGERAEVVYHSVEGMFQSTEKVDGTIQITIQDNKKLGQQQRAAEMMLSMLAASRSLEKYDTVEVEQVEMELLSSLFQFMQELDWGKRDDLFTRYYFPFFQGITKTGHIEPFYHYTRLSAYDSSAHWCDVHNDDLSAMFDALDVLGLSP